MDAMDSVLNGLDDGGAGVDRIDLEAPRKCATEMCTETNNLERHVDGAGTDEENDSALDATALSNFRRKNSVC